MQDAVKFVLLVPNITRWSSYYYAVDKVCDIVRKYSETTLNNVCTTLSVALFRPIDISFIMEYSKVMQTMAQALDILQSEEKCYMGILLPTIVSLKKQLLKTSENLKLASPLVDAYLVEPDTSPISSAVGRRYRFKRNNTAASNESYDR